VILVDTSVWKVALHRGHSDEALGLRALLDSDQVALATPVRIEILSGTRASDLARLRRVLSALPQFSSGAGTWERIEAFVMKAVPAGERFGVADLLIAAIAAENELEVWSLDGDFARMARLGFVRVIDASAT
jgi:predicted nucleic acid-binding protein